jgi:hypothetical protein
MANWLLSSTVFVASKAAIATCSLKSDAVLSWRYLGVATREDDALIGTTIVCCTFYLTDDYRWSAANHRR